MDLSSEAASCDAAGKTSAGPVAQATAALTYQQFYKAIFTTVHTLYPGHNAAGYCFFLEAMFEQWTAGAYTRPLSSSS
jgi:hypothetical protein